MKQLNRSKISIITNSRKKKIREQLPILLNNTSILQNTLKITVLNDKTMFPFLCSLSEINTGPFQTSEVELFAKRINYLFFPEISDV